MKLVSWNLNGLAACRRKGFLRFLAGTAPDIFCCQEIKTKCPLHTPGYFQYWNPAKRKGYAGTLVLARREPLSFALGFGVEELDEEGRFIALEYPAYYILNAYFPSVHPHMGPDRRAYREAWETGLRDYIARLEKPVILAGDCNVTRSHLDTYPENQRNVPDDDLFQSDLRADFEKLLALGLIDAFRALHPDREGEYTWWSPKNRSRETNRGSRLDYFLVSGPLLASVREVKLHRDVLGSDHCPISMTVNPPRDREKLGEEDLALLWRTMDWDKAGAELRNLQRDLAQAAYLRDWREVRRQQERIVLSWPARALAVKRVAEANAERGVDGVRWETDAEKCRAARSLRAYGYRPLPYRHTEIVDSNGKRRVIHIPAARDKAMLTLYAYALDPVAEATGDKKSFSARKGRSALDAHAYLERDLQGTGAPDWVVRVDVEAYYSKILHERLLAAVPMDKRILRKFLKAGVVREGELFHSDRGISLGTSLSPILGNMLLDGLQSYLYDRLYPEGKVDYLDGNAIRFADDILITARTRDSAERILQAVEAFLGERGLRANQEKTYLARVGDGFEFLGRYYQRRNGVLTVRPSQGSVERLERELEGMILSFQGPLRTLVEKINAKLRGWGAYHRVEDAFYEFRRIDAVVEGLLVKRMCERYPRWHRETVLHRFWVREDGHYLFALPQDPTVRVTRLAPTPIVKHTLCKLNRNPYLDPDYFAWVRHRREVQKAGGKYRAVWNRQGGRCAYCGSPMLPDQEIDLIEKTLGEGWKAPNLLYIHRGCAGDVLENATGEEGVGVDLASLLEGVLDHGGEEESPYTELREFFRLCQKTPVRLTFGQIEEILGDDLEWEAYFFEAFWYDCVPGKTSAMWREEGFPFHMLKPSNSGHCIAEAWLSQGYRIKALHLREERVVFRRAIHHQSGLLVPRDLLEKKLPDTAVQECNNFFRYIRKKYGF